MTRAGKARKRPETGAGVSAEDMDALLEFLPVLEKPGFSFGRWSGGGIDGEVDREVDGEGATSMPCFIPGRDAARFVRTLHDHNWIEPFDWPGWQKRAARYLRSPGGLKRAGLGTLRKLLTLHVRKERFCEGHLSAVHESGHLVAILRRLQAIRARMK
jgi:hypothetical protein